MGIHEIPNNHHWNYFLMLDSDTIELSRFIEFSQQNFETYSLELARLLMSAAAEVDVVAKIACRRISSNRKCSNINQYHAILSAGRPSLKQFPVQATRFGLKFKPWTSWTALKSPKWWTACNQVKHHRDSAFPDANLKNALNAVAGLYVMLLYAFPDEARLGGLRPKPQLFSVPDSHVEDYGPIEDGTPIMYRL